jgi:ribosomal protein L13E
MGVGEALSSRKKQPTEATKAKVQGPTGKAPQARVTSRHGLETLERAARGFSIGELSEAGMLVRNARAWGASVDQRRRTVLHSNVEAIQAWSSHARKRAAALAEPGRVEQGVAKAERALKKEAAEVEKEVVKVEKKAKKAAAKVEKEVVGKAQKPKKPRSRKAPKQE